MQHTLVLCHVHGPALQLPQLLQPQLNGTGLVTLWCSTWQRLEEREDGALTLEETTDSADEESSSAGSGGGVEVNGVLVPQLLLDRTQAALERFGVSR